MSYKTVNIAANDMTLFGRICAAVASEGFTEQPTAYANQVKWAVASASDVEAAYASALAAGNPDPGGDEAVITDGMILANVQPNLPPLP